MRRASGFNTQEALCVIAARRMIVGILGCQYERRLVTHSETVTTDLHKRVRAHKQGHLGRRRPEQKEALQKALTQLVKEGVVSQGELPDGKLALALTGHSARLSATRIKKRNRPKRRASTTVRKRAA